MDLSKLMTAAKAGVPYTSRPDLAPLTEAAYLALARATSVRGGQAVVGGEVHGLVKAASGLYVLAIGEDTPGPIDPDLTLIKAT